MKNYHDKGWVRLHRGIEDWPLYFSEPFTKSQAWIDMVLKANYEKGFISIRGNIIEIQRGQLGWSEESLASRWQWSRGKVKRFINWLKTVQQIEQQKTALISIITIINYDKYQPDGTTDGHQTVQQTDTKNKNNKNKELNNIKEIYKEKFEDFWNLYPRKVGKDNAYKSWLKLLPEDRQKCIEVIPLHSSQEQWKTKEYIPHPATWLNGGRWKDEIQPAKKWKEKRELLLCSVCNEIMSESAICSKCQSAEAQTEAQPSEFIGDYTY